MTYMTIVEIILSLIAIFFAIVLHEVSHGYVAWKLGDPTARQRGRLTLNPLAHVDLIGTIVVPLALAFFRFVLAWGLPLFGWAKPVPINPNYFKNPFRGMLYVAIAGPGSNILLALVAAGLGNLLALAVPNSVRAGLVALTSLGLLGNLLYAALYFLAFFVLWNLILATFNLIPIPPLDGSRILMYFLPPAGRRALLSLERYGFIIVLAVVYLGGLQFLFNGVGALWEMFIGMPWAAGLLS